MIRVLHLIVGLETGGAEWQLARVVPRLDRLGFHTGVLALKTGGAPEAALRENHIDVRCLGGRGVWDVSVVARARRFVNEWNPDILHGHLLWANALAAGLRGARRFVWHEHDSSDWKKPHHGWVERLALPRADRVIAVSASVAADVRRRHPAMADRVEVIPWGVPDVEEGPSDPGETPVLPPVIDGAVWVGFFGRLDEPKKGLRPLLNAFGLARRRDPRLRLLIAGEGPARGLLEAEARRLGVAEAVFWAGPYRRIRPLLDRVDIVAIPSLWEGFGLVAIEAMAGARPVVASAVGGLAETIVPGVTGDLVAPGDAPGLAEALGRLALDPARRDRLARAGRERYESHHQIGVTVSKWEALYRSLRPSS